MEMFFLLLGLGFFLYMMWFSHWVQSDRLDREDQRRREFGIPNEGKRFHRKPTKK